jgi:hypothetical protein
MGLIDLFITAVHYHKGALKVRKSGKIFYLHPSVIKILKRASYPMSPTRGQLESERVANCGKLWQIYRTW